MCLPRCTCEGIGFASDLQATPSHCFYRSNITIIEIVGTMVMFVVYVLLVILCVYLLLQ